MTNLGNPQWKLWATPYSSHSIPNIPNLQPQPSSSWPHARGCGCSAVIDQESIGQHPGVADTTRHDESHRAQAWPSVPAAEHGLQDILGGASSFLLASIILLRVVYVVVFGLFKWLMFNQFVSFPYFHNNIQGTRLGEYPTTFGHTLECLQRSQGQNQITRWTDESTTILHIHVQRRLGMLCKSVPCLHYPVKSMCVYFFGVCCSSKFTELQLWFVWFLAGGFPPGEEIETEERLPRRLHGDGPSDRDVFCLVKQFMSDGFLSQDPLLVLPNALKLESDYFIRMANRAPAVDPFLSPERIEELRHMATEIAEDFPHMGRAVTYYKTLLVENPKVEPYPRIKFLGQVDRSNARWCKFNLGEQHPRPKPHALKVTFHRARGRDWT